MTGSWPRRLLAVAALVVALPLSNGAASAESGALRLRAHLIGAAPPPAPLTIDVHRWSTDAERAPLIAALSPPSAAPAAAPPPGPARGRGGRGGRAGRGGAPPAGPLDRLTAAIKAAPTVGFIWGAGPTGYSIKYGWRAPLADGGQRVVLITDRRIGAHAAAWPQPSAPAGDREFTVIEMRLGASGSGQAKTSLAADVVVDAAANTLALDGYAAAPALLEVRP